MSQNLSLIDSDIPERDKEHPGEWFADAESEAEWAEYISSPGTISTTESIGDLRQSGLLEDFFEKTKVCEQGWREAESRFKILQADNEKLNIQLSNEKYKASKYEKKLKYIEENHEIFGRLKEAYLNMKYNESAGRPMVEIKEMACQTSNGIEAVEEKQKMSNHLSNESSNVYVKRKELTKVQETMKLLKEMVENREESWGLNMDRVNNYNAEIMALKNEIKLVREMLEAKTIEVDVLKIGDNDIIENPLKDPSILKKIIVKLEKRRRELEKLDKSGKRKSQLNEREKHILHQIIEKYLTTVEKKNAANPRSMSCDRIPTSSLRIPIFNKSEIVQSKNHRKTSPKRKVVIKCISKGGHGEGREYMTEMEAVKSSTALPEHKLSFEARKDDRINTIDEVESIEDLIDFTDKPLECR